MPAMRALGRFVRHAASRTLGSSRISDAARHPYWGPSTFSGSRPQAVIQSIPSGLWKPEAITAPIFWLGW